MKQLKALALLIGLFWLTGIALWAFNADKKIADIFIGRVALLGILLLVCSQRLRQIIADYAQTSMLGYAGFVLAGLAFGLLTKLLQLTALNHGLAISPGAGQLVVPNAGLTTVDMVLLITAATLLAPALEELLFRLIGIGLVGQAIIKAGLVGPARINRFLVFWAILVSIVFALLHRPEPATFPVYLASSLFYSWLYLRYGLLAAFLGHAANNAGSVLLQYY